MNIEYIRSLQPDRIQISNIFVLKYLTKNEYRIYLILETWPNTNIEYMKCKLLMTHLPHKVNSKQVLVHIYAVTCGFLLPVDHII